MRPLAAARRSTSCGSRRPRLRRLRLRRPPAPQADAAQPAVQRASSTTGSAARVGVTLRAGRADAAARSTSPTPAPASAPDQLDLLFMPFERLGAEHDRRRGHRHRARALAAARRGDGRHARRRVSTSAAGSTFCVELPGRRGARRALRAARRARRASTAADEPAPGTLTRSCTSRTTWPTSSSSSASWPQRATSSSSRRCRAGSASSWPASTARR